MSDGADNTDGETLVFECDLDAPPEQVWRAISTPEIREAWLGEPEAGPSEVTRADPGSRLDLVWPTREGDGQVSFEISEGQGAGTHLTIVHRMFAPNVVVLRPARTVVATASSWRMAA
ncbi:MAG TPA: hypothetical protein VHX64_12655 [Caulobacteraceae bacterium]|nr:hypothetical protein [Caulobacteraceae bacterium]